MRVVRASRRHPFPSRYHSSSDMTGPSLPSLRLLMLMTALGGSAGRQVLGGVPPTTNSILVRHLSSFGPALGGVIKYRFVERTQSRHLPSQKSPFQVGLLCGSGCDWECLPVSCHLMSSCSPAIARYIIRAFSDTRDRLWAQRLCTPRIRWGFRPRCWGPCSS